MVRYHVIAQGGSFDHEFDGEPQINLTFEHDGSVYKVVTRAHDEAADADAATPMLHAELV